MALPSQNVSQRNSSYRGTENGKTTNDTNISTADSAENADKGKQTDLTSPIRVLRVIRGQSIA